MPTILYKVAGHVARITLNRPQSSNRLDEAMTAELRDACQQVIEDDDVRVVLIAGAGGSFCAGAEGEATAKDIEMRRVTPAIAAIPKPVIAAVHGEALGQGLELALACDLRVAAQGARLALDQIERGLIPWDGGTQRLPRLIPKGFAVEMITLGRALGAGEALRLGLVTAVHPAGELEAKAGEMAARLANMAPIANAYAKEAVRKGLDLPLDQALRLETDLAVLLHGTTDRAEGLDAFLKKREARFTGR